MFAQKLLLLLPVAMSVLAAPVAVNNGMETRIYSIQAKRVDATVAAMNHAAAQHKRSGDEEQSFTWKRTPEDGSPPDWKRTPEDGSPPDWKRALEDGSPPDW